MSHLKEETPLFLSHVYPPPSLKDSSLPAFSILLQSFFEEQCRKQLNGYVWLREAPKVAIEFSSGNEDVSRLSISMKHGGSVEDEWLVVHLLMLATTDNRFSEQALLKTLEDCQLESGQEKGAIVIDTSDEDGQFLLIEAADQLPNWVQPNNADGRLWIYQGQFHLITPEIHSGDLATNTTEDNFDYSEVKGCKTGTALKLVRQSTQDTRVPHSFEEAIVKQRLPSYPSLTWASYNQHTTLAYLPLRAAQMLEQYPQLVSVAAEAFDGREGPSDARCVRDMKIFGPMTPLAEEENFEESLSSVVLVKVKLPRRLYATLLTQRYLPTKAFGEEWRKLVALYWEGLEKISKGESDVEMKGETLQGRRRDLGCKITCGLELAYAIVKDRYKSKQTNNMFSNSSETDQRATVSYAPFITALTNIGYFGSNIKDSQEWKKKEKEALALWRQSQSNTSGIENEHTSDTLYHLVEFVAEIGKSKGPNPIQSFDFKSPDHLLALEEDPDGFLYDIPESVQAGEGESSRGGVGEEGETEEERVAMNQVNAFADKLQSFVEGKGDEAGALFEDEEMESDGDDEEENSSSKKQPEEMNKEEKDEAMKNLIPRLAEEEWGAKTKVPQQSNAIDEISIDGEIENNKVSGKDVPSSDTAKGFSRRVQYDGASDSEESVDDEVLRAGDTDEDRLNRAKWLGMEKELEEDEAYRRKRREDGDEPNDEEEEEDINLGQDDLINFIEFTRKELGLSMEQYEDILQQRRERGAYVPEMAGSREEKSNNTFADSKSKKVAFDVPLMEEQPQLMDEGPEEHKSGIKILAEKREEKAKSLQNQRTTAEEKEKARQKAQRALEEVEEASVGKGQNQQQSRNTNLIDPFEKLMKAMDEELQKHKSQGDVGVEYQTEVKGDDSDEEMMDEMSAEDAELLEKMLHSGPPASLRALMEKQQRGGEGDGLSTVEEEVMQSMLASYQAQMGGAGPVGALAGRFGVGRLPRNADS